MMTIRKLRTHQPIDPASPPDWRTSIGQIAVEIETVDGLTGYGVGGGGAAGMHVIREVLEPMLLGRPVEPIEAHWQRMYEATLPFGQKGVAIMAISGVDLALWDLRAKAAGLSVARCLREHESSPVDRPIDTPLPTYSTVWDEVDPETAAGSQAVKLHVHPTSTVRLADTIEAGVAATRSAIGPDRDLMVDAWMMWPEDETLDIINRLAAHNVSWVEEPLPIHSYDAYTRLVEQSPIPIAGGEHEFTAYGFRQIIEQRAHAVLQPDVCWCGGMTELVKIYRMAKDAGLRVIPHRGCEVWGLHAVAALDPQPLAETGRPWMSWVHGQPPIVDGHILLTDKPGFGVTFA